MRLQSPCPLPGRILCPSKRHGQVWHRRARKVEFREAGGLDPGKADSEQQGGPAYCPWRSSMWRRSSGLSPGHILKAKGGRERK